MKQRSFIVAITVAGLILSPLSVMANALHYLGKTQSVTGVDQLATQYHYTGKVSSDSGQYVRATLAHHAKAQDVYVPVTLLGHASSCRVGQLCARVLGNGNVVLYQYAYNAKTNPYRSLSQQTVYQTSDGGQQYHQVSQTQYHYDFNDQMTALVRVIGQAKPLNTQNQYDALGRLVRSGQTSAPDQYVYDANDNIQQNTGRSVLTNNENGLDQSIEVNHHLVNYDGNGNQKNSARGESYYFNARNQLVGYQNTAQSERYHYQYYADGYRANKQDNTHQLSFYYQGKQLLNTVDAQQQAVHYLLATKRLYRQVNGLNGQQIVANHSHYELLGQRGDVNGHLNAAGKVVSVVQYGAYGLPLNTLNQPVIARREATRSDKLSLDPFGYDSEYRDAESGLSYLRARYYNPSSRHFISQDSYRLMNRYVFVKADPVNRTDPGGHISSKTFRNQLFAGFANLPLALAAIFGTHGSFLSMSQMDRAGSDALSENWRFGFAGGVLAAAMLGQYLINGADTGRWGKKGAISIAIGFMAGLVVDMAGAPALALLNEGGLAMPIGSLISSKFTGNLLMSSMTQIGTAVASAALMHQKIKTATWIGLAASTVFLTFVGSVIRDGYLSEEQGLENETTSKSISNAGYMENNESPTLSHNEPISPTDSNESVSPVVTGDEMSDSGSIVRYNDYDVRTYPQTRLLGSFDDRSSV